MMSNELLKRKILDSIYNNKDNNYVIEKVIKVFDIVGGSQPPKSQFSEDEKDGYVRLYQTRDYGEKPVPVYVEKNSVSKFTKKGDILLARYGGSLGKVFIAEEGAYNVALAKVIIKDSKRFYNKFENYYFLSSKYQNFTKSLSKMAQAGFNKNDLSDLTIIIPPLEEQKKIVKKIEELFELIDKKEKNDKEKEKLKTLLKEKILDSAIHGKIIENDLSLPAVDVEETKDAVPFDIPNNWKWVNIYNIFTTSSGSFLSEEEKIKEGEYPVYGGNGIISNYINYNVEKDTLVIGRVGYYCGNVKLTLTKSWVNDNALIVKMKIKDYYSKYMLYILNNSDLKNRNSSTAQPVVSYSKIKNILIPIPPLEQQKKIVEKIEECFKLIEQL